MSLGIDHSGKAQPQTHLVDPEFDFDSVFDFNQDLDFDLFDAAPSGGLDTSKSIAPPPDNSPLSADILLCTPHTDFQESFGASLFDLQPGSGATINVSDGPGIAAENDLQVFSMG